MIDKTKISEDAEKSFSARKSLFQSPTSQRKKTDNGTNEHILLGLIQKQCLYIGAIEKELQFYRVSSITNASVLYSPLSIEIFVSCSFQREVPGIINESKILISNEESARMGRADAVSQRLFSLVDTISIQKGSAHNHQSCENQREKLLRELAAAREQIRMLGDQSSSHVCWSGMPQPQIIEDLTR